MAKLITKNNENVTAANYDNAYGSAVLFTRDTGSGVESWCLYQQDPTHISNWYVFQGWPTARCRCRTAFWTCCCRCI